MENDKLEYYIHDLGLLLKEKAKDAKNEKESSLGKDLDYNLGYMMAFHDIISVIKQQANVFEIDQELIVLDDIEPEKDLL